ncbi:MAG TPA: aminotransferase class III-fold pyridoxal phosphate-dependent enzyme [Minicystis sp.]|nr:aminotransferase class III-fold pyridoxal phosphate-dependent enzyme [Minicystis sp.]
MNGKPVDITKSNQLWERAVGLIPAGTQTLAKGPGQWVRGVAPKYLARGKGSHVWDVDGNEFVDLVMGVGPLSLGYAYPAVDKAIQAQLADGITFSMMHPLEVEVAELVRDTVPNAEAVRYSKTGCDATTAAVRVARAFTGREKVLCCGYHGWHDWYIAVTDRNRGIPKATQDLTFTFQYNDLQSVEDALDEDVACVILEPTVFEAPKPGFLEGLRALCDKKGALLVFDEMWTGFRIALGGAQEFFKVRADLACFSKAIANDMPISVLTGRRDVMKLFDKDVFFFTTFGGEALSLAAAKATIHELRDKKVPEHLTKQGQKLKDGYVAIAREAGLEGVTGCVGYPYRSLCTFTGADALEAKSYVQQEMLARGVLWQGFHTMCLSHTDSDVDLVLAAYREVLPMLKRVRDAGTLKQELRGEPVEPVFRKTTNFHMKPKTK